MAPFRVASSVTPSEPLVRDRPGRVPVVLALPHVEQYPSLGREIMAKVTAIVLAAGASSRMKSSRSKVIHQLAGRPLLHYPILAALGAKVDHTIVVAGPHNSDDVLQCLQALPDFQYSLAIQQTPRGTGDAARAAAPLLQGDRALLLYGDAALIDAATLTSLIQTHEQSDDCLLSVLTCQLSEPFGYGRILRNSEGDVVAIREQKDLLPAQQSILEVNAGIYYGSAALFRRALASLTNDNAQHEYYATDIVEFAAREGKVRSVAADADVLQGVNDRSQLFALEQLLFQRIATKHRRAGVTIGAGVCIDDTVEIEAEVTILAGAALRGNTSVRGGASVDQGSIITNSSIGEGVVVKPYSVITDSQVGPNAHVGPFAHLRPGSDVGREAHVGNYVELKNTKLHDGAKANHLSYLGDGEVGAGANIGAGTIFCNYDGFSKARTQIGAGAFIGSDSQLIAPVNIGEGAYVATGTTVTADVPADALAIGRNRQVNKEGYAPHLRQRLQEAAAKKAAPES